MEIKKLFNGIFKITAGTPERLTPVTFKQYGAKEGLLNNLSDNPLPFDALKIEFKTVNAGCVIKIPLGSEEKIYGFGLQLKGFNQTGRKKHIRPNADPLSDSGDSHAPIPYYVSTAGYAVLIDTARYASFYCGQAKAPEKNADNKSFSLQASTDELYAADSRKNAKMLVEIPVAKGADIYIFSGINMLEAVQKHNLFSGGGVSFPDWSLGIWYRCHTALDAKGWLEAAEKFRKENIPCSVLGLAVGFLFLLVCVG